MTKYINNDLSINPLNNKRSIIFFATLLTLCVVYVLPIILADRLYIDDILRSQTGKTRWWVNARPLADSVMEWMNFNGTNIVDVSPLNLLLAILIFSYCSFLYYQRNMQCFRPLIGSFMMFLVVANPFMLENLSYKFDVLPMVLSISVLLIPFIFLSNVYILSVVAIICIVSSLCLYQASLGFFVCLSIIEFNKYISSNDQNKLQNAFKFVILRVIQLVIAYIIYSQISHHYISGEYNIKHSQPVSFNYVGMTSVFEHALVYIGKINLYLQEIQYIVYLLIAALLVHIAKTTYLTFKTNGVSLLTISSVLILIVSSTAIVSFSFLHLSFLKYPVYSDRVLISFGGVTLFFTWCYFSISKAKIYSCLLSVPLLVFCMVYSYSYGNALKHQKEFDAVLSASLAGKISELDPDAKKSVLTYGNQPSSKQRTNTVKRFQSLKSLVPLYYTGGWWGTQLIKMYGIKNTVVGATTLQQACDMKKEFENQTYQIYSDESNLLITFERANCK
ncbi:glucosyltransferase domain-containing protein [Escherichia coli]